MRVCTFLASDWPMEEVAPQVESDIWNTPDKRNPERPSYYCLTITR